MGTIPLISLVLETFTACPIFWTFQRWSPVNEATHIVDDGTQTCINLICTHQPYLFIDTGVLPTLDPHSKHNIIHGTLNFNFPSPPCYKRKVCNCNSAKI